MRAQNIREINELIKLNENILERCLYSKSQIESFFRYHSEPKGYSKGTSYIDADTIHGSKKEYHPEDYQKLIEELGRLESIIFLQTEILDNLNKLREDLINSTKELEGIEYKVVVMHNLEGKTLREISEELGYSYQYIREVHQRAYTKHTDID